MNNDPEQILAQLSPCRTSNELRSQVLDAIDAELRSVRQWRRQRRLGLATVAMVLLSVALNFWVNHTISQRIALLYGPLPVSRQAMESANFIAKYTDAQTGQWVYQQMTSHQPQPISTEQYYAFLQKLTIEYENILREPRHEKIKENSPVDGNRRGDADRNSSHSRRHLFLDIRQTA
jgi:hypothetical protein